MKRLVHNLFALAACATFAAAQPSNPIQRLKLDPMVVTRIPVARDRLTTIRFPSPLSDLQAVTVAAEPHPDALFQIAFRPGNAFFSVRALAANTNTTINAVWKDQTYVIELVESHEPWLSVIFDVPPAPAPPPPAVPKQVTPARLLGLLDTARGFALLRQQYPGSFAGVEVARPNSVRDYGDYTVRIEEVFRFDPEDTLVFRIAVSNKTDSLIYYLPESLMVRVGTRFYYQSIAEATGILPVQEELPIYLAITTSSDGSRNALSPHNDFMVLFSRLESPAKPAPSDTPASTPDTAGEPPSAAAQPTGNPAHPAAPAAPANGPALPRSIPPVPPPSEATDPPIVPPVLPPAPVPPPTAPESST